MNGCKNRIAMAVILAWCLLACGCGYSMRGKVVAGDRSAVEVVHATDPRLNGPGLANAEVWVRANDSDQKAEALTAKRRTNAAGSFSMRLDDLGSLKPHQQWLVEARQRGCENATAVVTIPAATGWKVLITMAPAAGPESE